MKPFILLLLFIGACGPVIPPTPAPPTPVVLTVTPGLMPTLTLTAAPVVTVQPTPTPGGFRMPTVRAIPVSSVDVTAWICHDEHYWWDVTDNGMTLHEDPDGERLCLKEKTE